MLAIVVTFFQRREIHIGKFDIFLYFVGEVARQKYYGAMGFMDFNIVRRGLIAGRLTQNESL